VAWTAAGMPLDCFTFYDPTLAVTQGAWTSGTPGTAVTITEDGMQGLRGGALAKTITGSAGNIVVTRGASASSGSGKEQIFAVTGTSAQAVGLHFDKSINRVVLVTPDSVSHTSTQFSMQQGVFYTYELAYLYTGAAFIYEVYINGTKLLDVGSSIATATVPSMNSLNIFSGVTNGLDQRSFIACKKYSGSGGQWSASDLYCQADPAIAALLKRGSLRPSADGRWPATTPSRSWIPSTGSSYFGVLDETIASTTDYISEFTDVNGSPGGAPNYLDRASWAFADSPSNVLTVPHVQFNNLVEMLNGNATYSIYLKNNVADDSATAITPITASGSWTWRQDAYDTDPRNGNIAWSKTLLDNLEVAIEPVNFT
jgi:hypothetical protein